MNNISFGQYVPGNSWIYRLDPRLKIVLTIVLIVALFLIPNLYGVLIGLGIYVVIFMTTRIPPLKVLKGLKGVMFLLMFTVILQLVYTKGDEADLLYSFNMQLGLFQILIIIALLFIYFKTKRFVKLRFIYLLTIVFMGFCVMWCNPFGLFSWNFILSFNSFEFNMYKEGCMNAGYIFCRIVLMIGITSLLTLTTMTTDINNGLEAVLSPLKVIKVPVGMLAMLISLTLRFIPTLMQESRKIMNAQASRGVDFNEGSLKDKINQIISLLIPMFVISFQRADDLSNAMEARGYVIEAKRTKLDELKLKALDYFVLVVTIGLLALAIVGRVYA